MSGYDFVRALRSDPATQRIPVLFLTSDDAVASEAAKFGAAYLTKPVKADVLLDRVRKLAPLPFPHAKRAGQSIHRVSVGTEEHPLAAYVQGSVLRKSQQGFTLSTLHPTRYQHTCAFVDERRSVDRHTAMLFERS